MTDVKYPDISAKLTGEDGNAMSVIAAVTKSLRRHHIPKTEINEFVTEAMSGDYNNVLATCMRWVHVS